MKDGRIVLIAGFLIILALFGFSYYGKKVPAPTSAEIQTSINSAIPDDNKASVSSTAPTENKAPVSSTVPDEDKVAVSSAGTAENKAPASSAAPTESKIPLSSAATIEEAKKNGESMWLLFRSTTCAPCVEMQKIFDQLESDYKGKVRFIAIDVNDRTNIEILRSWKIKYIPTTFIIDGTGKLSYQNVGIIPTVDLKKELNQVVK